MNQLFAPLTNVALPSLSRVYTRGDFGVHIRSAANIVTLVGAACFTALFAVAPWFTPLILGPSWEDATPILRWLCIGAMFQAATFPFFWVFLASRRTSQLLRYTLVSKPIAICLVVCGAVMGGGEGAAMGLALGFAAAWPICAAWLRSDRTFEVRELFLDASRILACGLSGILASFAIGSAVNGLVTQAFVSLGSAAVTCFLVGTLLGVQDCIRRSLAVVARANRHGRRRCGRRPQHDQRTDVTQMLPVAALAFFLCLLIASASPIGRVHFYCALSPWVRSGLTRSSTRAALRRLTTSASLAQLRASL